MKIFSTAPTEGSNLDVQNVQDYPTQTQNLQTDAKTSQSLNNLQKLERGYAYETGDAICDNDDSSSTVKVKRNSSRDDPNAPDTVEINGKKYNVTPGTADEPGAKVVITVDPNAPNESDRTVELPVRDTCTGRDCATSEQEVDVPSSLNSK